MSTLARKPVRCICPTCETEWWQNADGTWYCDPDWGRLGYDRWKKDPTEGGRLFCPVCAGNTATAADHLRFITQEQLHRAFLDWLIDSDEEAVTCFRAMLAPDPEWLEHRIAEFIQDRQEQEFVEWRCGG